MWLSENRSPCRSTPTTYRPTPVQVSSQGCKELQLGGTRLELEEAEGSAEEKPAAVVRPDAHLDALPVVDRLRRALTGRYYAVE